MSNGQGDHSSPTGTPDTTLLDSRIGKVLDDRGYKGGPGDSGGNNVEARIAKLEATVEHIQSDMRDVKEDVRDHRRDGERDFRILFGAIITVALGLAALMARGFHWF